MKTINISLETKDPDYATALSKSLQHHSKYFSIQLNRPQQDYHECDLLLTEDMSVSAERIVFLTEDPTAERIDEENRLYILYKYQHIGHISNMLRVAHSAFSKTEMLSEQTEQANIISVCSSSGGTGCTAVALGICQELTRFHGKKVLYISLEEFESTSGYFPESKFQTNNITKFLYLILSNNGKSSCIPEGYLQKDEYGVFAFYPARGRNPLRELTENEFRQFINQITKYSLFTDLILDCGNGLDASIVSALQLSANVCHVRGMSSDVSRRANYLLTITNRMDATDLIVLLNVVNRYVKPQEETSAIITETENMEIKIEEDYASFEVVNERTILSLDKVFGQGIREIVQRMVLSDT